MICGKHLSENEVYGEDNRSNTEVRAGKGIPRPCCDRPVRGALEAGATVEEYVLGDLRMSPCMEIYACKEGGRCVIEDDFQRIYDQLLTCRGLMIASPIFFYSVSAQTKILIDRCQSLWVKKYLIEKAVLGVRECGRKALFIAAGATSGKKLFDGTLLTMKYFSRCAGYGPLAIASFTGGLNNEGDVLQVPRVPGGGPSGRERTL